MTHRVLFYVQHLLGIGHVKRAAAIAAAMAQDGLEVTVAHGGEPVADVAYAGCRHVQLPSATIRDGDFSTLIDEHGAAVDEAWRKRRRDALFNVMKTTDPDVVLFELFPFGRRQFRFELVPLIEALKTRSPRPRLLASVRDILVKATKPEREEEVAQRVLADFDEVLVHGDPSFVRFDDSFGPTARIADKLRYTGYVSSENAGSPGEGVAADETGRNEVVLSAGGGAAGFPLMMAALAARPETKARHLEWRVLTGPRLPEPEFRMIEAYAARDFGSGMGRIVVERFRDDFPSVLRRAALSISQGGYNTTIDILRTGVPALVVPFGGGVETEQADRAIRLAERGYLHVLSEDDLAKGRLRAAIDAALDDAPRRRAMPPVDFALEGAANTARIVAEHAKAVR